MHALAPGAEVEPDVQMVQTSSVPGRPFVHEFAPHTQPAAGEVEFELAGQAVHPTPGLTYVPGAHSEHVVGPEMAQERSAFLE